MTLNNKINRFSAILEDIIYLFRREEDPYKIFKSLMEMKRDNPKEEFEILFDSTLQILDIPPVLIIIWSVRNEFNLFKSSDEIWEFIIKKFAEHGLMREATIFAHIKALKAADTEILTKLISSEFSFTICEEIHEMFIAIHTKFSSEFDPLMEILDKVIIAGSITSDELMTFFKFAPVIKQWCQHQIELERNFCD